MSHKREQLASSLKRTLGTLLASGLNDPRVSGLISVTEVDLAPDGRSAKVKISVMPETAEKRTIEGLRHAARHLQSEVGRKLRTRTVPHLQFVADPSIKKQAAVLAAIQEAVSEDEARHPSDAVDDGQRQTSINTTPESDTDASTSAEESSP